MERDWFRWQFCRLLAGLERSNIVRRWHRKRGVDKSRSVFLGGSRCICSPFQNQEGLFHFFAWVNKQLSPSSPKEVPSSSIYYRSCHYSWHPARGEVVCTASAVQILMFQQILMLGNLYGRKSRRWFHQILTLLVCRFCWFCLVGIRSQIPRKEKPQDRGSFDA